MAGAQKLQELITACRYEEALGVEFSAPIHEVDWAATLLSHEYADDLEVVESLAMAAAEIRAERNRPKEAGIRWRNIGVQLSRDGNKTDALPYLQKAVDLCGEGFDHHWLGSTMVQAGKLMEALPYLERAVELRGEGIDYHWLGSTMVQAGKLTEALPYLEKAVELRGDEDDRTLLQKTRTRAGVEPSKPRREPVSDRAERKPPRKRRSSSRWLWRPRIVAATFVVVALMAMAGVWLSQSSSAPAYLVGGTGPAGGLIFYDKGDDSGGWRYLEAAPASTEWEKAEWGAVGTSIPGADGTAAGTGNQNTSALIAVLGNGSTYAAQLCDGLTFGGFSDWFLPSRDELALMSANLASKGLGGLGSDLYWSSSEYDASSAWPQDFGSTTQGVGRKDYEFKVRAVRAFSSTGSATTGVPSATATAVSASSSGGGTARAYAIGDTGPAGGLIFYDKGDDSGGWRYLEAASASTEWESAEWGAGGTVIPGADGTAIGTGSKNTTAMVAVQGKGGTYAAQLCAGLTSGGFSDWFLPSYDELDLIRANLSDRGVGGFVAGYYWSSSQIDANSSWSVYFGNVDETTAGQLTTCRVRAVRAFSAPGSVVTTTSTLPTTTIVSTFTTTTTTAFPTTTTGTAQHATTTTHRATITTKPSPPRTTSTTRPPGPPTTFGPGPPTTFGPG